MEKQVGGGPSGRAGIQSPLPTQMLSLEVWRVFSCVWALYVLSLS